MSCSPPASCAFNNSIRQKDYLNQITQSMVVVIDIWTETMTPNGPF